MAIRTRSQFSGLAIILVVSQLAWGAGERSRSVNPTVIASRTVPLDIAFSESLDELFPLTESPINWNSPRRTYDQEPSVSDRDLWSVSPVDTESDWIVRGQSKDAGGGGDDLSSQINDPTAALTAISFQNTYVPTFYGVPEGANVFTFRPVIPMKVFGQNQILRVSAPYSINGPGGDGLQPVSIFDLFVFEESWGRWGVGPLVSFRPATVPGLDTFEIGPAAGFTTQQGAWTLGFFNQNLFSNDVAVSSFQPIVAYTISKQWSVSLGDIQLAYDWKSAQWASLPFGMQVNYITKVLGSPLRFYYNPQYNFRQLNGNPEWSHTMGVSLLLP